VPASRIDLLPTPRASDDRTDARASAVRLGPYTFKAAQTPDELEQVHRLNYQTFVREIPQHADPGDGERLVDKFHDKNLYFVAKREGRVIGMVSAHAQPPFSVAGKLADPAALNALGDRLLEVRLLAVGPAERNSMVFAGLGWCLHTHAQRAGFSHLVISGIRDRQRLYERMGFAPLGPAVQSGDAWFIPMAMRVGRGPDSLLALIDRVGARVKTKGGAEKKKRRVARLTPGPVQVGDEVRRAFRRASVYHRTPSFIAMFQDVRRRLSDLVGGSDVALLSGSGTLANDAVAANLAADPATGPGLVLVNGEFGQRLARQAARAGLRSRTLEWDWGRPWDIAAIEAALQADLSINWIWGVHLETSTGVLNDLPALTRVCKSRGVRVCLDCMSSLGAVPLDLSAVHMASGTSGKSLGSYAGVAFVLAAPGALTQVRRERVAPSLDAAAAIEAHGPRFTFASPQVTALHEALKTYDTPDLRHERYESYARLGALVRAGLRAAGIDPIAPDSCAAPVITSFAAPAAMTPALFVALCRGWGFEIGGLSEYLEKRAWGQIATMGAVREREVRGLMRRVARHLRS
jgi:aspartate aminotransferase-like enzyme/predicted N-acetyltransferase YhbS